MKYLAIIPVLLCMLMLIGCKKTLPPDNRPSVVNNPSVINSTSSTYNFKINAGYVILVEFPLTEARLSGSYSYSGTTQLSVTTVWSMISGPRSVIIENPDSLNTKIKNLILGIYEFELKGKLMNGSVFKDTVKVIVNRLPASTREIVVNDLTWIFPWYNAVEIKNFYNLAPDFVPDTYFNLYIQRPPSNDWVQVEETHGNATSSMYQYYYQSGPHSFYTSGSMYIFYYGQDVSDKPSIKIVY